MMRGIKKSVFFTVLLLILSGCLNHFIPPEEVKELEQNVKGLTITITGDAVTARTLYPDIPGFSKYEIYYYGGPRGRDDTIILQGDTTSVTIEDLEAGQWYIEVTGYVIVNENELPAARGNRTILIEPGPEAQTLTIPINVYQNDWEPGTFNYSVAWPEGKASSGYISIVSFDYNQHIDTYYMYNNPSSGSYSLSPGFYVMTLRLQTSYRDVIRSEIIHIYSNLETNAKYNFTEEDFTETFILNGALDIRINDDTTERPDNAYVNVILDGRQQGQGYINFDDNSWSVVLPCYDQDATLTFQLQAYVYGQWFEHSFDETLIVRNQDISVDLAYINIKAIALSGTINVTYGGQPVNEFIIYVYNPISGNRSFTFNSPGANEPWVIPMLPFNSDTNVTFRITGYQNFYYDNGNLGYTQQIFDMSNFTSVTVYDESISNINLNPGNLPGIVSDLDDPYSLTMNEWVVGEIVNYNDIDWYSINVTAGTTYYIWGNDSWWGNGKRTMPIDIYAYYSDGTIVYTRHESTWDEPALFTARSNDTVYIRVRGYGNSYIGTYGIVYSTNNKRPGTGELFINPSPLTENTWVNGNITTSYDIHWYSIDVNAGTTYYFWWNDSNSGNGSKTLDIEVSAYDSSEYTLWNYDSAWYSPVSITSDIDDTIYIRVRDWYGSNTGTYGIVYSETNNMPATDIIPAVTIQLTEGLWVDGEITEPLTEVWYSFDALEDTNYYLWWNDNQGIGTNNKSAYLYVQAFYGDETPISINRESSAWNNPASFTARSNETVYIKVRGYYRDINSTGAYGITYSTVYERPTAGLFSSVTYQLTENIWVNGEIVNSYNNNWYSMDITEGVTYNIWWNDSYSGNGNKTVDIDVYAYDSSGYSIYLWNNDSAWNTPVSFTAEIDDTIYLRVRGYGGGSSTGTYGIVYSTGDNRPDIEDVSLSVIIELRGLGEWDLLNQRVNAIANVNRNFTVSGNYAEYRWYLDGVLQSDETSYMYAFNAGPGTYELTVIVTDYNNERRSGRCWITVR